VTHPLVLVVFCGGISEVNSCKEFVFRSIVSGNLENKVGEKKILKKNSAAIQECEKLFPYLENSFAEMQGQGCCKD